jgi:uncharacterized membrane protein YtjA (UPF0391 family)
MFIWAVVFFVIAVIAGLLGFTSIASGAADNAKICFYSSIVLFIVFLILGDWRRKKFKPNSQLYPPSSFE